MIQEKIDEVLGLEKAAQKAVEELDSKGLLKSEHMIRVNKIKWSSTSQVAIDVSIM